MENLFDQFFDFFDSKLYWDSQFESSRNLLIYGHLEFRLDSKSSPFNVEVQIWSFHLNFEGELWRLSNTVAMACSNGQIRTILIPILIKVCKRKRSLCWLVIDAFRSSFRFAPFTFFLSTPETRPPPNAFTLETRKAKTRQFYLAIFEGKKENISKISTHKNSDSQIQRLALLEVATPKRFKLEPRSTPTSFTDVDSHRTSHRTFLQAISPYPSERFRLAQTAGHQSGHQTRSGASRRTDESFLGAIKKLLLRFPVCVRVSSERLIGEHRRWITDAFELRRLLLYRRSLAAVFAVPCQLMSWHWDPNWTPQKDPNEIRCIWHSNFFRKFLDLFEPFFNLLIRLSAFKSLAFIFRALWLKDFWKFSFCKIRNQQRFGLPNRKLWRSVAFEKDLLQDDHRSL